MRLRIDMPGAWRIQRGNARGNCRPHIRARVTHRCPTSREIKRNQAWESPAALPAILTLRLPRQVGAIGGRNSRGRGRPPGSPGILLEARASCPLEHRWAFSPLAGGTPAVPGKTAPHRRSPGSAGILPASTHRWAFGPLAGGTPALPGKTAPHRRSPGSAGILPASTHRWAFGPLAGGTPALPGKTAPHRRSPGSAGILPASTHRWAFGPLAGGTPALPGTARRATGWRGAAPCVRRSRWWRRGCRGEPPPSGPRRSASEISSRRTSGAARLPGRSRADRLLFPR